MLQDYVELVVNRLLQEKQIVIETIIASPTADLSFYHSKVAEILAIERSINIICNAHKERYDTFNDEQPKLRTVPSN